MAEPQLTTPPLIFIIELISLIKGGTASCGSRLILIGLLCFP